MKNILGEINRSDIAKKKRKEKKKISELKATAIETIQNETQRKKPTDLVPLPPKSTNPEDQ